MTIMVGAWQQTGEIPHWENRHKAARESAKWECLCFWKLKPTSDTATPQATPSQQFHQLGTKHFHMWAYGVTFIQTTTETNVRFLSSQESLILKKKNSFLSSWIRRYLHDLNFIPANMNKSFKKCRYVTRRLYFTNWNQEASALDPVSWRQVIPA